MFTSSDLSALDASNLTRSALFGARGPTPQLIARENSPIVGTSVLYGEIASFGSAAVLSSSGQVIGVVDTRQVGGGDSSFASFLYSLPFNLVRTGLIEEEGVTMPIPSLRSSG